MGGSAPGRRSLGYRAHAVHDANAEIALGRTLSDLRRVLGTLEIFNAVVAENGAICAFPGLGRSSRNAPAIPPEFLDGLRQQGVEATAGECLVDVSADAAHQVLDVIRTRELPLTLHFNRGRLMVMPQAVSKGTGLRHALQSMRLSPHNTIGVGDAENDHALLAACEMGAAVAWGSQSLQRAADVVVPGHGPADLAPWIREVAQSPTFLRVDHRRGSFVVGWDDDHQPIEMTIRARNILVSGGMP